MKKILLALPLLALTACYNFHKMDHTHMHNKGDYYSTLAIKYKKMAKDEARNNQWIDAERFAKKSLDAYHHKIVTPDDPNNRWLSSEMKEEFKHFRNEIVWLDNPHNRKKHPQSLAALVSSYDMLLDEQEEKWSVESVLLKREEFLRNLRHFIKHIHSKPHKDVVHSEILYFNNDSSYIGKLGKTILMRSLTKLMDKHGNFSKIIISAHTDKVGTEAGNKNLSLQRASNVKEALMELGVKESLIEIHNCGNAKTVKNSKAHPRNRRVEIDFMK